MADDLSLNCWKSIHELSTSSNFCGFLKALEVWIERPHVLNRRLMGALILKKFSIPASEHLDLERLSLDAKLLDPVSTRCAPKTGEETKLNLSQINDGLDEDEEKSNVIILRKLLPRQHDRKDLMFELVIVDSHQREVVFVPLSTKSSVEDNDICDCQSWLRHSQCKKNSYRLLFKTPGSEKAARIVLQVVGIVDIDGSIQYSDSTRDGVFCPTVQWLQSQLVPKLCKWAEEIQSNGCSKGSLRLVPLDQYTLIYNRLKQDYGEKFVKIWPERTDPHKFVYEDVAIAAYLLVLWKEERDKRGLDKKQSFVDLGCGNGLLVHILSEEGHPGFGVDIRQRNIWSLYGESTRLEEMAIDPTAPYLFQDVDWFIGNHSDELTPWIPVMAARASYRSCYFVLPCCLFDFNCKFVRKNNKVTQYRGYLDFVQEVGETCGFEVEEDSLRIPSTKRICHIGRLRSYREEYQSGRERLISDMIRQRGCNIDERKTAAAAIVKETEEIERWRVNIETGKHCMEQSCGATKNGVAENDYHEHNTQQDQLPENEKSEETYRPEAENHSVALTRSNDSELRVSKDHATPTSMTRVDLNESSYVVSGFQPRAYKEPVRNCASLEKSLKEFIVDTVARTLLGMPLVGDDAARTVAASASAFQGATKDGCCNSNWRKGGSLQLSQVARLFDKEILTQLKNECGGLQTLLRNHYYVFRVQGGTVQLKDWTQESRGPRIKKADSARRGRRSQALWKTSMCWFHTRHPDGCPVPAEKCPFAHGDGELRERPTLKYLNSL